MVNNVKLGTVNMPKLLRNLSNRSRQVRDLVFHRDAIFSKAVGTKKDTDGSPGAGGGRRYRCPRQRGRRRRGV